jgi:hypothetical protein
MIRNQSEREREWEKMLTGVSLDLVSQCTPARVRHISTDFLLLGFV